MIRGIKFISVPVKNQDAALAFYTEKLGFRVQTDQPFGPGQRWIEMAIPGADTGLALFTPPGHEDRIGSFFNGSLQCDNVEATHRQLSQRGVEFVEAPTKQAWGSFAKFRGLEVAHPAPELDR